MPNSQLALWTKTSVFTPVLGLTLAFTLIPPDALSAQTTINTASIAGAVHEQNGAPVPAAIVTAVSGNFVQRTFAAVNGTFRFTNLRAGAYSLCAQAPLPIQTGKVDDYFVDSCAWLDTSAPRITLAAAEARTQVMVPLQRGRLLTVHVNDPFKLLPAPIGAHSGNPLSVRISGLKTLVHRVPITGQDATGRDHSIVIPYDTPHKLWISSTTATLTDELNRSLASTPIDVQVAHGAPPKVYVVNVVAAKAVKP